MKALRIENGVVDLSEMAIPHRDGEALIRMSVAGICNTDLEIVRGYANFNGTLGHEFVGIVEESPDAEQIGRRVVGEINAGCGVCEDCKRGDSRHCLNRTVLGIHNRDGAFAEYLTLPPRNLLIIPDKISDIQAVFTEPLAAACEILDQVAINKNHQVAVIGDGKLGQLIARVIQTTGCDLILIGKHPAKLELAARDGIKGVASDSLTLKPGDRPDFVIEASGSPSGLKMALDLVRPRGTIILKSTFHGAVELDTSRIVVDEISIVGSRCGRFEKALRMMEQDEVDLGGLITSTYSLTDGVAAMNEAGQSSSMKIILLNKE
jgi:threonine dehydrogenase-like Zn-dependent dehydrogenase